MANLPAAEADLTEGQVRELLAGQFPDLAALPLRLVANGWDNAVFRLGDWLAVRLPRRAAAAQLVLHEQVWLPRLAAGLSGLDVAVPVPLRCGTPSPSYPWPWSVVRWFEGTTADVQVAAQRRHWAGRLAAVVDALQRPAPPDAPANPVRGVPLADRDQAVRQRLEAPAAAQLPRAAQALELWEELCAVRAWDGPALWLHGDLHPANLITDGGRLAAVVDFGDLTAGDPATDLAAAWLVFDAAGRRVFRQALAFRRDLDAATWRRARGWALNIATALLANSDDSPGLRRIGAFALDQVLGPGVGHEGPAEENGQGSPCAKRAGWP
ncbi:aminoglycoside phosphotransferase family protein [Arthrobacter sp. I2-34]|uniref:Aminoglycoside phosphotransferase family protein n=1 Tax=Arthrobacter hankyongi TaxID=2904801 RepID=A0ABS9L181_9MICC|nr:aminoglycoside phosphotransferase family protein [Arthrobacter hankyongi]MCG2620457.1 aminoglycoside phosphotransferase family protein [Arthrobacter hankyongi]